jgi:hypothetical protein
MRCRDVCCRQEGGSVSEPEQASLVWRKSTASADGSCAEVAVGAGVIYIRNSRQADGPFVEFEPREWSAFLEGVRNGEFDLPTALLPSAEED